MEIASRGVLHRITALVDATGAAQIECDAEPSEVIGTVVRVELPTTISFQSPDELVEAYTVFNPHLRLQFCGAVHLPTSDRFKKWQPDSPTPPHWYSKTDFRKLVGYARDRDPGTLLRDFVRRFKGLSSTQKAAAVCKVTQATTLEELAESAPDINKVLMEMKAQSKQLRSSVLGHLGEAYLASQLAAYGPRSPIRYKLATGIHEGLPWCLELAVARALVPALLVGVNYSPALASDAFSGTRFNFTFGGEEKSGVGLTGLLAPYHVNPHTSFAVVCHLSHPAPRFSDAGKTRLDLSDCSFGLFEAVEATCKQFFKEGERKRKGLVSRPKSKVSTGPSLKDTVGACLGQAIQDASGGGRFLFPIRNLFYSVRPLVQKYTRDELRYDYFTKLIDEVEAKRGEIPGMFRDARGHLVEPHTGKSLPLGTREVDSYDMPPWLYSRVLFVEKEGLLPLFQEAKIAERFDMAIVGSKGYATRAARTLLQQADRREMKIFCLHDADPAGYEIFRTLAEATRAMPDHRIEVIDLGLRLEETLDLGLQTETFDRKKRLSTGLHLTEKEREAFVGIRVGKKSWRCQRVEINALAADPDRFLQFFESKLKEHGCTEKLVPPADVVADDAALTLGLQLREQIWHEVERELGVDGLVEDIAIQLEPGFELGGIPLKLSTWAKGLGPERWRDRLRFEVENALSGDADVIRKAVIGKIRDGLPPE